MTKTGFPETRSAEQGFLLLADNAPVSTSHRLERDQFIQPFRNRAPS
jgi:hypothetical protein